MSGKEEAIDKIEMLIEIYNKMKMRIEEKEEEEDEKEEEVYNNNTTITTKKREQDDENALKIAEMIIYQSSQNYIGRACV